MSDDDSGYHTATEPALQSSINEWLIVDSNAGQTIITDKQLKAERQKNKKLVAALNKTIKVLSDHIGERPTEVLLMTSHYAKNKLVELLTMSTKLTEEDEERKELLLQREDIQFTIEEVLQYKVQALQCVHKDCNETTLAKFSAWQTIFDKHPTNVEKQKAESQARENREVPKRKEAVDKTRAIIPRNIEFLTEKNLRGMNMPVPLIRRIKKKSLRWLGLVWMPTATIAKLHISELRHQYAYSTKADITELRAVVACLPTDDEMESDPDGEKKDWANTFRMKLDELVRKEEIGSITTSELRHPAWKEVEKKGLQFQDPKADVLSITPTRSDAFDRDKEEEEDVNDDDDTSSNNVRMLSQLFNKQRKY